MKKLLLSALMATVFLMGTNAQNVITNDYSSPITGADGQSTTSTDDEAESFGYAGLMYYGFDGFDNWGIFYGFTSPNGLGLDAGLRAQFKSHGNFNGDILLNYSLGLWSQNNNQVLLTIAAGPSIRTYDEIDGVDKKGNLKYSSGKTAFDGIINPRLTIKFGKIVVTGGYFYWAPKFKFSKDDGATGGFNIGLGYSF